jgi:CBS-domain-containing membrane protein
MEVCNTCPSISREDLRAALADLKTYVDITEEDLLKIYILAVRHARERLSTKIAVQDVMTHKVFSVHRDAEIAEAARVLSEQKISGMPVLDEKGGVIGVISEADILASAGLGKKRTAGDLVRRLLGEPVPEKKEGHRVADVMNAPPITIGPFEDIKEVAAILDKQRIKRLPVVDNDGKLLGIVSRGDIIRAMGKKL